MGNKATFTSVRDAIIDWGDYIANPRYILREGNSTGELIITWADDSKIRTIEPVDSTQVDEMARNGQFSFQIKRDGSIVQLRYVFDRRDTLKVATLAYYKRHINDPVEINEIEDDDLATQEASADPWPGWFRLDFAPDSVNGLLHSACHLHLGSIIDSRLMVASVPTPRQFVELVFSMCYPDDFRAHRLDDANIYRDGTRIRTMHAARLPFSEEAAKLDIFCHLRFP